MSLSHIIPHIHNLETVIPDLHCQVEVDFRLVGVCIPSPGLAELHY